MGKIDYTGIPRVTRCLIEIFAFSGVDILSNIDDVRPPLLVYDKTIIGKENNSTYKTHTQ